MESDTTRKRPSELVFSESLISSIVHGETGSDSRKDAIEDIKERTGNLGNRLRQFVQDLEFLYRSEYFEQWSDLWRLMSVYRTDEQVGDWQLWTGDVTEHGDSTLAVQFGMTLAQIPRFFVEGCEYAAPPVEDLVWGFLIGLVSRDVDEYDSETQEMSDIVEDIEERIASRRRWADDLINSEPPGFEEGDVGTEIELIKSKGFVPTQPLLHYLRANARAEVMSIPPSDDTNPYEWAYGSLLVDLENEPRFSNVHSVRKYLQYDHKRLQRSGWHGIIPTDIIRAIAETDKRARPGDIADFVDEHYENDVTVDPSTVGKFLNDLAGEGGDTRGPNFDTRPTVDNTGDVPKLTPYGKLLYHMILKDDASWDELHAWAFSHTEADDQIRDAIEAVVFQQFTSPESPASSDLSTPTDPSTPPDDLTPPDHLSEK